MGFVDRISSYKPKNIVLFVIMNALEKIKGVDIYLLDQLVKSNINKEQRVLDAGCGRGRNLRFLLQSGFDVTGIDSDKNSIDLLKVDYPHLSNQFINSDLESFTDDKGYNAIICNAVLHFAKGHEYFDLMFSKLISLLNSEGVLFIRMTSDIGIESLLRNGSDGVFIIPDGSTRYLITRSKIDTLLKKHDLSLIEKVKTVNVDSDRCMTTLVMRKKY